MSIATCPNDWGGDVYEKILYSAPPLRAESYKPTQTPSPWMGCQNQAPS